MKNKFYIGLLLLLAAAPAMAEGMYVVGAVGATNLKVNKGDVDAVLVSAGATGVNSTADKSDTGYKLQLGYKLNNNWAVEGGYFDLGKYTYQATYTGGAATMSAKARGVNLDVVGSASVTDSVTVFARLGIAHARVKVDVAATGPGGSASGSPSSTKARPHYGVGATYNFNRQMGVRFELEEYNKIGNENSTGRGSVDMISVGLVAAF